MKQIAESELILNKNGSVYHLNLHPEDIAETIINVGDPDRVEQVSKFFDKVEIRKQKREFITHTGYYNGKRLSVISTGIGTDNIDIVYNELDALVNIDFQKRTIKPRLRSVDLVRIGTSGALQAEIAPDSFVCASYGLGLDGLMNYYPFRYTEEEGKLAAAIEEHLPTEGRFSKPYVFRADNQLFETLSKDLNTGITASCQGFYGPQARELRIPTDRPRLIDQLSTFAYRGIRVTNFEMETGAMYGMSKMLGHRCCSVNLIVANRITQQFSKDAHSAMDKMIELVLSRLAP